MRCLDSCRQRYTWIQLTQAVEKFSFSLAKQLQELSQKLDSLKKDLSTQNNQRKEQISELSRKIELLRERLISASPVQPWDESQNQ